MESVWAILHFQTIRRMVKMRMMMKKIQSLACSVKMTNPAGWWAQSTTWYSTTWRVFVISGWCLTNWPNRDGWTQLTTSIREIWCKGWPNPWFRQLLSLEQTSLQPQHPHRNLGSLCRLLILTAENRKCCKGHLDQAVVKWSWVQGHNSHTYA